MLVLSDFLVLGAILFCLSVAGIFINRKNVIILLMCIELMLLAVNMNFIAFSHFSGDIAGQVAPQLTVVMLPLPFPVVVSAWVDVLGVWVQPKGAGGP
jgi:NADH:ubiquinone oxidoreductase subunit K